MNTKLSNIPSNIIIFVNIQCLPVCNHFYWALSLIIDDINDKIIFFLKQSSNFNLFIYLANIMFVKLIT